MAVTIDDRYVSWKGLKALQVMTNTLPDKISGAKVRGAYRYALLPTKEKMRNNIYGGKFNRRTGALWHSIDTTVKGQQYKLDTIYAIVGPRRRKNVWNMQGWHSHIVEDGAKPHVIKAKNVAMMPVFTKGGIVGYRKSFKHPGSPGTKPFSRAIASTSGLVADRVSDKISEIMRDEIKSIWNEYGQVVTRGNL